ncbi:MAG: hypothetical protein CME26_13940 [Gemmatimonadetes bacterium]|nr:hypothetical protein [Gemmatimonadota bacterium]
MANLPHLEWVLLAENEISDLLPLAQNVGLDQGDSVDLRQNLLSEEALTTQIGSLEARGVTVER